MSILVIDAAAESRALLTPAQLRTAAGAADNSRDAELADIGLRVADMIAEYCCVPGDGITPTTLRQETLTETFRLSGCVQPLILARRFLGAVSVVEDGVTLAAADFEIEAGAGMLYRLCDDIRTRWPARKIVVTYQAGFATVPSTLVTAAMRLVRLDLSQTARDPLVKRERVRTDDVEEIETDYWGGSATDGSLIPSDTAEALAQYATQQIG